MLFEFVKNPVQKTLEAGELLAACLDMLRSRRAVCKGSVLMCAAVRSNTLARLLAGYSAAKGYVEARLFTAGTECSHFAVGMQDDF